nr:PREDICTED: 3beta-hydroxysteroid-dehydrogenase/decarboxylase isoform 2-like [Nicotiana sylvestris]XP_016442916.1 PREDICTED: 3beta-hydroxysteroid-dehydrogenase/decarboxylase-like [Nicotiana tabacum]
MMPIAHLVELTYKLFAPFGMKVPQLTPSRIRLLSRSRTFSCSKASDRIGYTPIVPLQEGLRRTIESYPHLRAEHGQGKEGPSKSSASLWMFFLMVVFSLLILSILGTISPWILFGIGIAAAFVVFFICDKRKKK